MNSGIVVGLTLLICIGVNSNSRTGSQTPPPAPATMPQPQSSPQSSQTNQVQTAPSSLETAQPVLQPSPQQQPAVTGTPSPQTQQPPGTQPTTQQQNPTQQPKQSPPVLPGTPPAPGATSAAQSPAIGTLSLDDAIKLAGTQMSAFQQAGINERIAAEDVKQAQIAFLPKISAPLAYTYTTPLWGAPAGTPKGPSFIAANAIGEYQAFVNVSGDFNISGKLSATLRRNQALLDAARAGTAVAKRTLQEATTESYYGLALALARLYSAETSLAAAEEFERITSLLLSGGEVAQVDVTRAQLQSTQRRDDLERARSDAAIAGDALRIIVGYDFGQAIASQSLSLAPPPPNEIEQITADSITSRPEFAQFEAERRAAEEDVKIARAERLPSLSYSVNGGFDTDSVHAPRLKEHTGASAAISLNIPIFDFGASRSREQQARLRIQLAESQRIQETRALYQQFYSSRTAALSSRSRISLGLVGLRQAESNLSTSIARYRAGEAPILEVTDAETTLATQRLALYQAIYDYQTARARLLQAAGK